MTNREQLKQAMIENGFDVTDFQGEPFQGCLKLVPSHRKDTDGNHNIIDGIHFVIWGGSNVKPGDLGCVTFYYGGKERIKHKRQARPSEMLKKAWCPKSAKEAIEQYDIWRENTRKQINSWKVVL